MGILGFFQRDRAFEARLEACRPRLVRTARAWVRNPVLADDLVQDSLIKALRQAQQLRAPEALQSWLLAIMANCLKDHFRRHRETADIDEIGEELLASNLTPEHDYERNQTTQRVRQAIDRLPLGMRQVVTLVDLEECSYADVALILEIPIGTVMSRLFRARKSLRELLLEYMQASAATDAPKIIRIK